MLSKISPANQRQRTGFTLAEMMISITILVMIAGTVGTLAVSVEQASEHCRGQSLVAQHARIAMSRIHELIAADDTNVLQAIFSNLKNMTQLDTARIFHMFTIHKDAAIRLEVARSSDTNAELLHRLARDEDPDVRGAVLTTLRLHSTIDTDNDWGD